MYMFYIYIAPGAPYIPYKCCPILKILPINSNLIPYIPYNRLPNIEKIFAQSQFQHKKRVFNIYKFPYRY